jgi:glycosyltransferase involved in cell wall biosynthesis
MMQLGDLVVTSLRERMARLPEAHAQAVRERLELVARTLSSGVSAAGPNTGDPLTTVLDLLVDASHAEVWLLLAVVGGRLPDGLATEAAARAAVLDGPTAAVAAALDQIDLATRPAIVRIAVDETLVDLHNTVQAPFFTGIQRVARESARNWDAVHSVTLVAWTDDLSCPRELCETERRSILGLPQGPDGSPDRADLEYLLVVPWKATYLIPELAAERPRTSRQLAMARYTSTTVGVIGFDTVPLTSSETTGDGMPGEFAGYLAAARYYDRIGTISEAAAVEYRGWRTMLVGVGMSGPEIQSIPLAAEVSAPLAGDMAVARSRLVIGDLPMVLCVGTHEPRKNHLSVLHAAELLWREGQQFGLTFIGGHTWNSEDFMRKLRELQVNNRPIETISGVGDGMLSAAYRLARFTVFPSFNEGFGLPVAESLASGTPVITSKYGSMREIAEVGGGALLVDPRDDHDLAAAMRQLLNDEVTYTRLCLEAAVRPTRRWDEYAADLWEFFVEDPMR